MRDRTTILDAARQWVGGFNAIPHGMIDALMRHDPDSWHEVTQMKVGDRVYVYESGDYGEITKYNTKTEKFTVELDNGKIVKVEKDDMEKEDDDILPMWGTLWSFNDSADDYWLSDLDGIRLMSECGFRIYEHEEWGYFFGIDGAGYDFYEAHWVPLYKARGLQWHDEAAEKEHQMLKKGYKKGKLGMKKYWFDGDQAIEEVKEE